MIFHDLCRLSSLSTNVIWGSVNAVMAYLLVTKVGTFGFRDAAHAGTFGFGAFLMSLSLARYFGKFLGGIEAARRRDEMIMHQSFE